MSKRFLPVMTPETATYWEKAKEHELWLPRCTACDKVIFYPRSFCPGCNSDAIEWFQASGRGVVESFVINSMPAPGYEEIGPYAIAFIQLEEGVRLTSNLVDVEQTPEAIRIGMPVEVTFEDRGEMSVPQFRPVVAEGATA